MKYKKRVKIIPDRLFHKLWNESMKCENAEQFIRDFTNPLGKNYIDFNRKYDIDIVSSTYMLNNIYELSHLEFSEIIEKAGQKQADISHIFCISIRTIQDWYSGKNKCPSYIKLMLLKQFHLFYLGKYIRVQSEIDYVNSKPSIYNKVEKSEEFVTEQKQKKMKSIEIENNFEYEQKDRNSLENANAKLEEESLDDDELWFLDRMSSVVDHTEIVNQLAGREVENRRVQDLLAQTEYLKKLYR